MCYIFARARLICCATSPERGKRRVSRVMVCDCWLAEKSACLLGLAGACYTWFSNEIYPNIYSLVSAKTANTWFVPKRSVTELLFSWLSRCASKNSFKSLQFQTWKKQDSVNKRNKTLKVRKRKKPPNSSLVSTLILFPQLALDYFVLNSRRRKKQKFRGC